MGQVDALPLGQRGREGLFPFGLKLKAPGVHRWRSSNDLEASDESAALSAEFENQRAAQPSAEDDGLQLILWDLAHSQHLRSSQRLASMIQQELNGATGLRDRGVKQAPFRVLMGANMPSVLVELGFLSNPDEEEKLNEAEYRSELVGALVDAIARFQAGGSRIEPDQAHCRQETATGAKTVQGSEQEDKAKPTDG